MTRTSWIALVAVASLVAACAQTDSASSDALNNQPQTQTETAPTTQEPASEPGGFTESQVRAFAAASVEIDPISSGLANATPEEQAQATTQIRAILDRHNIDADTYNAIAQRAQTDAALATRVVELRPGAFSDAQLRAFVTAAGEIQPITETLATASPEQRAAATEQIRAALERNGLDGPTYNAIAQRAQNDPEIAARIAAIQTGAEGDSGSEE